MKRKRKHENRSGMRASVIVWLGVSVYCMRLGLGGVVGLQGAYKAEWKKKHCKNIHDFIRISRKHIVCVYAICICGAFFSRDVSFFFGVVGSRTAQIDMAGAH